MYNPVEVLGTDDGQQGTVIKHGQDRLLTAKPDEDGYSAAYSPHVTSTSFASLV